MLRLMLLFVLCCLPVSTPTASAQTLQQPGDTTRITVRYETETESDGSSSSSRGSFHYFERVLAVTDAGAEIEFSIPPDAEESQRADWQFPVRILFQPSGDALITNREELIARRDQFLEDAGMTEEACGSWIFTWNAFKIECELDDIVDQVSILRLQPQELAEGTMISSRSGQGSAPLSFVGSDETKSVYSAEFPVDPEIVRLSAAQSDVASGEIMGQPITLEEALALREHDQISGTIAVYLQTDPTGVVNTRVETSDIEYVEAGEDAEYRHSVWGVRREPL